MSSSKPYRVEVTLDSGYVAGEDYTSKQEAHDARDRAFMLGFTRVRILGLPATVYVAGFNFPDDEIDLKIE